MVACRRVFFYPATLQLSMAWYVYIVECADRTLYTGITTDLHRRLDEHNGSLVGAKYTRTRRPVRQVYFVECESRSVAAKEEARIKGLPKEGKQQLILSFIEKS
jgi:putative endonuclease